MSADTLWAAALRRSNLRVYVGYMITGTHNVDAMSYDIESLVTELDELNADLGVITPFAFWSIAARHEFDEHGTTDAALEKALVNSRTGWVAIVRRPDGDVQSLNLKQGDADATPASIEATLREFVSFPQGTSITVLPLVG